MKIRNGFVSNSSSSSFILKFGDERYPNTATIAESMLKDKYADYGDDGYTGWEATAKKAFNNIEKLKNGDDPYIPIYFSSCNYNTYIIPLTNNYCLIETCNNTQWLVKDSPNVVKFIPDEVLEKYPSSEGFGGFDTYIIEEGKFNHYGEPLNIHYGEPLNVIYDKAYYLVEYGLELVSPPGYKTCDKCYHDVWYFGGKEYCIKCDWNKIIRGKKIKKLMNVFTQDK
jgi:hypothetical protein